MAECPTCGSTVTTWDEEAERVAEMDLIKLVHAFLGEGWRRSTDNGLEQKVEGLGYIVLVAHANFKAPTS